MRRKEKIMNNFENLFNELSELKDEFCKIWNKESDPIKKHGRLTEKYGQIIVVLEECMSNLPKADREKNILRLKAIKVKVQAIVIMSLNAYSPQRFFENMKRAIKSGFCNMADLKEVLDCPAEMDCEEIKCILAQLLDKMEEEVNGS